MNVAKTNYIIKKWIYEKIQGDAFCKGKTLIWDKQYEIDSNGDEIETFRIKVNEVLKQTDKAVYVDCSYWRHGSGRGINFTEYTGYKVWLPKSAILTVA